MNSGIVVVGSLNVDFVVSLERFPAPGETLTGHDFAIFPGGKGANQAFAAARLGGIVKMVGQVGNDTYADLLKQNLSSVGVDVSAVRRDSSVSSGIALVCIDAAGQNQIVIIPGSNGSFGGERLKPDHELIASAKLVLLQLEIPLETVEIAARVAKKGGALVILDPAPAQEVPDSLLSLSDYVTPNETELAILSGENPGKKLTNMEATENAQRLCRRGAGSVIVKMGSQGALLVSKNQKHFWPAIPVEAVDSTAAGDAFNAAFAVPLAGNKGELEAGTFATFAAALSVTKKGAQPSMPTLNEVKAFMKRTQGS
ncbi:ribokinase [bacterium]|nr:ribokinase [bacterium]